MTANVEAGRQEEMARPFPTGGNLIRLAYRELAIAANGDQEQVRALGDITQLPRPWDPPTCTRPDLREQVWAWLDDVVCWLNHEYTWDITGTIPACWPRHPHLVHEIAVIADQRRRAGLALTSNLMEEWHRYALPAFTDRMRSRTKDHCEEGHQRWPGKSRYTRHTSEGSASDRSRTYRTDVETIITRNTIPSVRPRLASVNLDTGEVTEE
ncbi:hypothetical protein [Segeticoccus rhizosphaerae]|uniref:hypothetical protein n=1 Tax=Segeticoccus rhizosphaerae TaxID=1104777 RepID=UPI001939C0CD|nr:hypothetical protein [Segeticoccus rhizosphaerae]